DGLRTAEIAFLLDRLAAQSLVHVSKGSATTSFCLWLPVRQFALEQLEQAGEVARVQGRMAEWSEVSDALATGCATALKTRALAESPVDERALAAPAKSRGRRAGVLSEREHDVVQLIAGGRSNREIADELVITKKTAEAHVSHILTKLGLCSRVQIATWSLTSIEGPRLEVRPTSRL
ncbi:MAG TPA: LuxR C-terminal-related transcriptional regulator, partial [Chloroflexota bacterium]